ncbi:MAG: LLM class F420-dependent oxidoreductase [Solirubrobacteraceae bacterium]
MPALRVSAQLQPQHSDWPAMRQAWAEAEELGVDCIFNWDHFFPLRGEPEGEHFEALTVLGAMAEVTERVELGSLVICNAYRNPEYLADAHRTIDHISGGRAILGIGAGWFEKDFDEYGYDFGTVGTRLTALEEAMPRIEARMGKLNPPPVRTPIPILIGGGGPKRTLKLVARYGNIWHSFGTSEVVAEKREILAEHCANEGGRDPAEIEVSWGAQNDDWDELRDAGVTHLILGVSGSPSGYDLGRLRELVEWRDSQS